MAKPGCENREVGCVWGVCSHAQWASGSLNVRLFEHRGWLGRIWPNIVVESRIER